VFKEEGAEQSFIYDCEICCSPIRVQVSFTTDEQPEISTERT
jgi:hypothetical protein